MSAPATPGAPAAPSADTAASAAHRRPRVAIQFCTQCKWMLRAAYFAQELLSTFGPALGEVALQPATGGVFTVSIETSATSKLLWDRKTEGGFPETKELKRRVRDVIEPGRDLGHVDRHGPGSAAVATAEAAAEAPVDAAPAKSTLEKTEKTEKAEKTEKSQPAGPVCEDCQ